MSNRAVRVLIAGGQRLPGTGARARAGARWPQVLTLTANRPGRPTSAGPSNPPTAAGTTVLESARAVINLAGDRIAGGRWSARRKAAIRDSRRRATAALARAINASGAPVALLSGSAVGYYGLRGDEVLTEADAAGDDFLADVCREWEAEARTATAASRVVLLRTGLVLARDGGALPQMALPFRFGVGGRVGSGRQYMSWVHLEDWIGVVRAALGGTVAGPINLTAPTPVTNAAFAAALGRALHRPALVPAPAVALRLAMGEMADALLLGGQRVVPAQAQALGYQFRFPTLAAALGEI